MYLNPETYENINRNVAEFLEDYGFIYYPFDPFFVFDSLGIQVVPYSELDFGIRALALQASEDAFHIAGSYTDFDSLVVAYNDQIDFCRIRFSLCHELAHIILEHKDENSEWSETEANYCAGYLLVPDPIAIIHGYETTEKIMDVFEVGYQCAKVAASHVWNRNRCGKPWEEYEMWFISACTVERGDDIGVVEAS